MNKMKKLEFSLLITFALAPGCKNPNQKIEIAPTIFFSIPQKTEFTVRDSIDYLKI